MNINRIQIAANLPPVQYGFRLETISYQERLIPYQGQTVLYYQYVMGSEAESIRVVPDGCTDILICCDPFRPHSLLCGTILQGESIRFLPGATYFGIRLTPLQNVQIRPLPFRDLINQQLPLTDVMKGVGSMCDAIAEKETFALRIAFFEQAFLPLLLSPHTSSELVDYCLQQIYRTRGTVTVDQLARDIGFSTRYIRKKFVETLGLSPKQYSRITRFQHTLSSMLTSTAAWSNLATEHGYYDQAHFIKDFKHFSMFTPMQIHSLIAEVAEKTMIL
ncbi:helix-turn-helix domain-containing protein [Brevibacillus fluminis]|uniref:Helix-turn-helix domain-containing protein n=1 Tax=Brevibacillus fluminis TaxID=511487 RepID=A0A3M8DVS0_9BACL|nr:helix-turn-helix domain-containing protein [Brevibacillus fluminis]RNB92024.1 helix-turn-helix domain-containing protein [Brevibacillus fluminis]